MIKLIFIVFLTGCDLTLGVIGEPNKPTSTNLKDPQYLPGKGFQCVSDEQCGDDAVCYKEDNNYTGVCSKVK